MKKSLPLILFLLVGISINAQTILRGTIIDEKTGEPIENAKIGVSQQGVGVLSNENGYFSYRKYDKVLDRTSKLQISATGYESLSLEIDQIREIYDTPSKIVMRKGEEAMATTDDAIHVFWDISEGMLGRDEDKELNFLENYLRQKGPVTVNFAVFNDKILFWKRLDVVNGDISRFRESIKNIGNFGPADYSLLQMEGAKEVLLFSNGNNSLGYLDVKQDVPVIVATTRDKYRDQAKLKSIAAYTSGKYIALDQENPEFVTDSNMTPVAEKQEIKGFVSSEGQALAGAKIQLKGTFNEFTTDKNGQFSVPAALEDVLICSYMGMFTREVIVDDTQLVIDLIPKNNVLDEVVITAKSENFVVNDRIVKGEQIEGAPGGITGRGYYYITAKDINVQGKDIIEVLKESFSSVRIVNDAFGNAGVEVAGTTFPFFINGSLYRGDALPYYIKDEDINSIIVKDDPDELGIKYGILEDIGNAIIVTTKQDTELQNKYKYTALAKGNDYKETVAAYNDAIISAVSVKGTVKSLGNPIEGASILLKGSFTESFSKNDGFFEIEAAPGEVLTINYLGMFPKSIEVPSSMEVAVDLIPKNDVLDEVVVTASKEEFIVSGKKISGNTNPSIPGGVTALGDFYITAKDITPNALTLERVVRDKFKNVVVSYTPKGEILKVGGVEPQYVVDGFLLGPGEPRPYYIADKDIESIIVKDSPNLTSRYSITPIAGLAIIITTKKGAGTYKAPNALAKNNIYTEEVSALENVIVSTKETAISGFVTSLGKPLQGVRILKIGSYEEYTSQSDGKFEIPAVVGDRFKATFLGMYPKTFAVENLTTPINIKLLPKSDVLDEVTLNAKKSNQEPEYAGPLQDLGKYKIDKTYVDVITLTGDDINFEAGLNSVKVLDGKLAGVTSGGDPFQEKLLVRGQEPHIFIDGMPADLVQLQNLPPQLISSVSVKKGLYGSVMGLQGPVVFIDTLYNEYNAKSQPGSALSKGNTYEENTTTSDNIIVSKAAQFVSGTVTSLDKPLQGVTISMTGSFEEYKTNAQGKFKIPAKEGDTFIALYLGMYPKSFDITDATNYTVNLIPKNDVLDEVTLTGEGRPERTIMTPTGEKNYDAVGYSTAQLTEEDLSGYPSLATALNGKFAGITAIDAINTPQAPPYLTALNHRGGAMGIVIDDQLFPPDVPRPYVDVNNVKEISIIRGIAGAVRYGSAAKNGVVIIKTMNYNNDVQKSKVGSALVKDNTYEEENLGQLYRNTAVAQTTGKDNIVRGVVRAEGRVLQGASVMLKGTLDEAYTNDKGIFAISAQPGDVLRVNYLGMFPKEVYVEPRKSNYVINLTSKNNELDEIVVQGVQRVDNTIQTAFGKENKDKIGYAVAEINEEDFNTGATSLRDLITGRFSGVTVTYNAYEGTAYRMRSTGSINNDVGPIWVVNGTPYQDEPTFLDVQQIANITVLKGLKAVSKYGTIARGGAFVINTKSNTFDKNGTSQPGSGIISGNNYQEETLTANEAENEAEYITRLREISSASDQFVAYQQMARTQELSLEFYSDVVRYFQNTNIESADKARSDLAYIARNNTKALRTLAYLYEEAKDYKKMLQTYERVLTIAPQESQSYRDVANALVVNKKYNKALEMYRNMLGERVKGVNFSGIEPVLKTELSRLVQLHKDKIEFDRLPNEWLRADFKQDVRMVIEWTNASVPFEFQFVNPDKKFFKWMHTLEDNRERLNQEQKEGFQMEEFVIDDAPQGEWIINVQYLGEDSDYVLPPFLKYTIYRNYGTASETKQTRILKIFKQSQKVTLGKIEI